MIPELGHFALILALCMASLQAFMSLAGTWLGIPRWVAVARPTAVAQFLFLALAFAALTYSFIANDFSVSYVAQNSNSALPLIYRISAVWGAHEGSLLLWVLMLGLWGLAVTVFSKGLPRDLAARVIGVMGLVSIGFLLFMLLTSNPFERLFPAPADGRDLNPLLQDPGLAIHPPMLYMGYVGFSVVFAFAIAALLGGRLDGAWARWSRPWTTLAWAFLTVGIALGSWWAYNELGWGGWWFWDPVENASFMPWLMGTALIHSLAVTEKRGAFKSWTVLLAIFTFALSLLGTFLVRSGVLVSVHAFATDPERGVFILVFLGVVIGGSLLLYAMRASKVPSEGRFSLFSRETFLLINNILLVVATVTVLLGTLYPLILDSLGLGKISVGPPYFDRVFVPLMLPLAFLLGIGPMVRWKKDQPRRVASKQRYAVVAALVIGISAPFLLMGQGSVMVVIATVLAVWALVTSLQNLLDRPRRDRGWFAGMASVSRSFQGMVLAHMGIGVFVIGVTFTGAYSVEKDVRMALNDTVELSGYTFRLEGVRQVSGPNFRAAEGRVRVMRGEEEIAVLEPQKRTYLVQTMPMTEAAIDVGPFRDLYVSLGEPLADGAWSVRIYHKPFIRWIWLGALMMAIGGLLAVSDRRYRVRARAGAGQNAQIAPLATEGKA
jgi:cytochrome c-type biogenesis protein CcmF